MIRALLFLRCVSLRNRLAASVRRLRQPKYLASFLVGVAYIYFFFLRRVHWGAGRRGPFARGMLTAIPAADLAIVGGAILFAVLFVSTLFAWNSATATARLKFSEAEISFLFPAPLSRQRLIHFNLLGSQFNILITAVIMTVLESGANALTRALGWWFILSTYSLWGNAMNFLAARALEAFGPLLRRRVLLLLAAAGVYLVHALWRAAHPPDALDPAALPASMVAYLAGWIHAGWGSRLLFPFSAVVRPFAAASVPAFLRVLPAALVLPALCYGVIVLMEVPFREGSILAAGRRAQSRAARRQAGGGAASPRALKPRRPPFRLDSRGRPEIAFFWKNLIGIQAWFNLRIAVSLLILATAIAVQVNGRGPPAAARAGSPYAVMVLTLAAIGGFYIMLLGPQLVRQDLRSDLLNADMLKVYPLRGWQIVAGQILTPALILAGLLWLAALAAGWAIFAGFPPTAGYSLGTRLVLLVCVAVVIPPVVLLQLVIPNGAALLFPAWHQTTRSRSGGIEGIGQRLIFTLGQFLAVLVALLPAAIAAGLVAFASSWILGPAVALILATLSLLVVVLSEVWIGLWWLGERFERLDIATELKP